MLAHGGEWGNAEKNLTTEEAKSTEKRSSTPLAEVNEETATPG
jgi:hypothetical protein